MNRRLLCQAVIVLMFLASRPYTTAQTHDHAAMATPDGEFNPYVVSDNREGFYLSYVQRRTGENNILFQRSLANGTFSAAVRVNDRSGDGAVRNENPPKIAVGPSGEIYVVWASERERWKGNIRFSRSLNGGKTFEPAINLNSDASQPPISRAFESIAVDSKGRIFVAWIDERNKTATDRGAEIWMAVSDDHGKTFSRDRKILSNVCECCRLALASDASGTIFLSYRTVPPSGPMFRDIAVARSSDGGKTFQSSIVHRDGWEINACPIDGATLTVDAAGRVHVVWFTASGDSPRLYIATSSDRGLSFTKPAVFDPNQKLAKHAHIVAVRDNRVLIAWDDLNTTSIVKWGFFDTTSRSLKLLGTQPAASYPIIAMNPNAISLVALQADKPEVFRTIRSVANR
jgi:hypothetical protein